MAVPLTQDFFDRAVVFHLAMYRSQLHAKLTQTLAVADRTPTDRAQFEQFFAATWDEATLTHALVDGATIGKFYKIRLSRNKWSQSPLHARYVTAMMSTGESGITLADGIAAVHQNIVEQHYA